MHTSSRLRLAKHAGSIALLLASGLSLSSLTNVKAESEESLSARGLKIAPVPLNLTGKNVELVGYGSYLVNAVADCNGCHTTSPQTEYAAGGNPYFSQKPTVINKDTYLAGGQSFGSLIPGTAVIVSRNLTPDKTGRPAGGHTYEEFHTILTTGVDMDNVHPTCISGPSVNCLLPPFDGTRLQIMPWPALSHLSEHDTRAIYEYLSAVPCIAGPPAPSVLHNDCQ
jgi:hypothetical protein